jgi:predicted RNase H-like HicB family nuclease
MRGRIIDEGGAKRVITFKVEVEQEDDGRWLAEVLELPGVLAYGQSQDAAVSKVQALALRVIAERPGLITTSSSISFEPRAKPPSRASG